MLIDLKFGRLVVTTDLYKQASPQSIYQQFHHPTTRVPLNKPSKDGVYDYT